MTWTEVSTSDGPMRVFEAAPSGEARGAVIVVQEAFGVNGHIQDVAGRLAKEGWYAAAPEFFHRAGAEPVAPYDDFSKVMALYDGLDQAGTLRDVDATLDLLHGHGFEDGSIGAVGFCWGGHVSFLIAARRQLGASVGFYGGGIASAGHFQGFPPLIDEAATLKTPWLGLFGDLDGSIPVDDVEALRAALESAPVDHEIVRYPQADHGFHCDARPGSYNADAAKDGWTRALSWFEAHVKR
jgi:carboxymethylenebutenolidase